jgi:hypothetical protein
MSSTKRSHSTSRTSTSHSQREKQQRVDNQTTDNTPPVAVDINTYVGLNPAMIDKAARPMIEKDFDTGNHVVGKGLFF